jgi:hypothetical protein
MIERTTLRYMKQLHCSRGGCLVVSRPPAYVGFLDGTLSINPQIKKVLEPVNDPSNIALRQQRPED